MPNPKTLEFSTKDFNPEFIFGSYAITRDSHSVVVWELSEITENSRFSKKENIGKLSAKQSKFFHTVKAALKCIRDLSHRDVEIDQDLGKYIEELENLDNLFFETLEKVKL